jgi:hypothetical protein
MDRDKIVKSRLSVHDIPTLRMQVVSPAVVGRPELDSTLADMSMISKRELEELRHIVLSGGHLDEDQMRRYDILSEIVMKQARLEMAVEKHVDERAASMQSEDLADGITRSIHKVLADYSLSGEAVERISWAILKELGLG